MTDADDYESLPESTPLYISSLAGATAGVAEHCVMYPVDSIKTRMQSLCCEKQHNGIRRVFLTMVHEEGLFRPMRGMSAMALGAGPAHAMYFTALEKTREALTVGRNVPEHLASGVAAVFATMLHDAVMTPAEVVKQRMQMCCSPFKTCLEATTTIFRQEGLAAFYRSYMTQLTMNVPFQAAMVSAYSVCQQLMNPGREYNPSVHFLAGAIAGGVGCAVTMPMDVCKTLLNTQEAAVLKQTNMTKVVGMFGAGQVVYRMTGFSGFFQGLSARLLYQAPSTAVSWSVYEFFKAYLKSRNNMVEDMKDYETIADIKRVSTEMSASHQLSLPTVTARAV